MKQIDKIDITQENLEIIEPLVAESLSLRFRFLARLVKEYRNGRNCFNKW